MDDKTILKQLNDVKKLVEINTKDIDTINDILKIEEVESDGFVVFKITIDKIYNEIDMNLNFEDYAAIKLFDENNNDITTISNVSYVYSKTSLKIMFNEKHKVRKLSIKSLRDRENGVVDEFSLYGSNDNSSFIKLSNYSDGGELLVYNTFVNFDVPQYIEHTSILDELLDDGCYIKNYQTIDEYNSDITRMKPSVCYVEDVDRIIYEK